MLVGAPQNCRYLGGCAARNPESGCEGTNSQGPTATLSFFGDRTEAELSSLQVFRGEPISDCRNLGGITLRGQQGGTAVVSAGGQWRTNGTACCPSNSCNQTCPYAMPNYDYTYPTTIESITVKNWYVDTDYGPLDLTLKAQWWGWECSPLGNIEYGGCAKCLCTAGVRIVPSFALGDLDGSASASVTVSFGPCDTPPSGATIILKECWLRNAVSTDISGGPTEPDPNAEFSDWAITIPVAPPDGITNPYCDNQFP